MVALASKFQSEAASFGTNSQKYKQLMSISGMLMQAADKVPAAAPATSATSPAVPAAPAPAGGNTKVDPNLMNSPLVPKETIGDGNKCPDDEEMVMGVCYKKCTDLTGGSHPIRTSPFTCCASKPCSLGNTWSHVGFCSGFDVAGDAEDKGGCPSSPGACLTNEEEFNGMCYRKCSDITNGKATNRVAAMSCCKTRGLACLLFTNLITDAAFAKGGGSGDGNEATPSQGHPPLPVTR